MHIGVTGPIDCNSLEAILDLKKGTFPIGLGGRIISLLVKGLLQEGHRVSIYGLSIEAKTPFHFSIDACTVHFGYFRPKHRAWDLFKKEADEICKQIVLDPPEIIHAHWSYEFAMGALNSCIPTVITIRDWAPLILRFNINHYRFLRLILNNQVFSKGKNFIANSLYIQKLASRKLKRDIPVIPNAMDESLFLLSDKKVNITHKKIISVNNGFAGHKNGKNLIIAFSLIRSEFIDAELLLAGFGYEPGGQANRWALKHGYKDGIKYLGFVNLNNLIELYNDADLLIHPSFEESFGNILIEAMCRKVPVIGGKNSGAVPWVLDNGKAGLLVDVHNPESIADAAKKILSDRDLWESYSNRGYQNVKERFTLPEITKQHLQLYESILK